ncbi:MAG: hypothetical protein WEB89_03160 [Balneolales bacterium]
MKSETLLTELEEVTGKLGYRIRRERGRFLGSPCVLEGDRIIMLNKNHPVDFNIGMLARFLGDQNLEALHIKPVVRKELEAFWKRSKINQPEEQKNLDV